MDWQVILGIAVLIFGAISGGLIIKLINLGKQIREFVVTVTSALKIDDQGKVQITAEEATNIAKEGQDVVEAASSVFKLFVKAK